MTRPDTFTHHLPAALIAAGIALSITTPSLASPPQAIAWALLGIGMALSFRWNPNRWLMVGVGVITASALAAVPVSLTTEAATTPTIILAFLTLILAPLAYVQCGPLVWRFLAPVWLIHAGVAVYQGVILGAGRAGGLAHNQNVGAAFLLLGIVYFLTLPTRWRWLAVPLVVALPYTGSRWSVVVSLGIISALLLAKHIRWQYVMVGVTVALFGVVFVDWGTVSASFNRGGGNVVEQVARDANYRLVDTRIHWGPYGFQDTNIHSVPLRMAHETGIWSALAWVGLTGYGLLTRPRFRVSWWLLACVGLLSLLYYSLWVGPLGAFWWLLVGTRSRAVDS